MQEMKEERQIEVNNNKNKKEGQNVTEKGIHMESDHNDCLLLDMHDQELLLTPKKKFKGYVSHPKLEGGGVR